MTLNLTDIEQKALAATQVVSWYSHGDEDGTVRGPYRRWFKCSEVDEMYKNRVGSVKDDCDYAAIAMNSVPILISIIRKQQEALGVLSDVYVCDCKEAIKIYRQSGPRAWCCECSNYIRNEDDATFYERVEKARQTLTEVNEVMG